MYHSKEVASLYSFLADLSQPYIAVPSMLAQGHTGDFSIRLCTSQPVIIQEIDQVVEREVAGEWLESSAGGSHINDPTFGGAVGNRLTWKKNPKYHINIKRTDKSSVNAVFTLSRSEKEWKKKAAKNSVGCMLGLYIYPTRTE